MIRSLGAVVLVCVAGFSALAQPASNPPEKEFYTYVGLQANQLLRALFSFGTPPAVVNPYMFTLATNNRETGVGFNMALGYSLFQTRTGDNFNLIDVTTGDFSLRMGVEKKMFISNRWIWSVAGDVVYHRLKETSEGVSPNTTPVTSTSTTTEGGFGPRCTLNFAITDRILLGTEASFYFMFGKETQVLGNTMLPPLPSRSFHNFVPSVPAALFLMIRF
jgi:hypothetical protein